MLFAPAVLERIIDITDEGARLSSRLGNLIIQRNDKPDTSVLFEDIAAIVLGSPQVLISQPALAGIAGAGGIVIICDDRRLPIAIQLPLQGHFIQCERMTLQMQAGLPLKKQLWKQIVRCKIESQSAVLSAVNGEDSGLRAMALRVRSGDPENIEAQAARRYWMALFGDPEFERNREADDINKLLNYGYTILRAIVSRAICAVGLHPSIGLQHHNRYSQFTLADDLMEPFRSIVDLAGVEIRRTLGPNPPLDRTTKAALFEWFTARYAFDGENRTLFDILGRMSFSLVAVLEGKATRLALPQFPQFLDDPPDGAKPRQ